MACAHISNGCHKLIHSFTVAVYLRLHVSTMPGPGRPPGFMVDFKVESRLRPGQPKTRIWSFKAEIMPTGFMQLHIKLKSKGTMFNPRSIAHLHFWQSQPPRCPRQSTTTTHAHAQAHAHDEGVTFDVMRPRVGRSLISNPPTMNTLNYFNSTCILFYS